MDTNTSIFLPRFDCSYFIISEDSNGCVDTSDVYYFGANTCEYRKSC